MALVISEEILDKLTKKHKVNRSEVEQCFANREGGLLTDNREMHKTNPPTQWFVAPTNINRFLKIMFVRDGSDVYLKSAYDATEEVRRIYDKHAF